MLPPSQVFGAVTLSNPTSRAVGFANVVVQLRGSWGSPLTVIATCASTSVPFSSNPSQVGSLTCFFQISLGSSFSGDFSSYNGQLQAQVSLGFGSSSSCPSSLYSLPPPYWQQQQQLPSGGDSGHQCHMISMTPSCWSQGGHWVGGKVVVTINVNSFHMGGIRIKVLITNSSQGRSQWVWASCPRGDYSAGSRALCSWSMPLPHHSNPSDWSAMQTIAYGSGGSSCNSGHMVHTGL